MYSSVLIITVTVLIITEYSYPSSPTTASPYTTVTCCLHFQCAYYAQTMIIQFIESYTIYCLKMKYGCYTYLADCLSASFMLYLLQVPCYVLPIL
jgi:hypothetical protein